MTEYARAKAKARKPPTPVKRKPARLSRQKLKRILANAEYMALRDIYLEQNPECSAPHCHNPASEIHHICRGVFRAQSLLNTNTWLGVCNSGCHGVVDSLTIEQQIKLKQRMVRATIERLRKLN